MRLGGRRSVRWLWCLVLLASAVALSGCDRAADLIPGGKGTPTPDDGSSRQVGGRQGIEPSEDELARALVQVLAVAEDGRTVRSGTGVVVDSGQRLVVTAYTVVRPYGGDGRAAYREIRLAPLREGQPRAQYVASIVAADAELGVAVLRVTGSLSDAPAFDLPGVALADASAVGAGTPIRLFGFPGEASPQQTLITQRNTILGQRGDPLRQSRVWLKTAARLPVGAAGGPVFSTNGTLLGILAQEIYNPRAAIGGIRPIEVILPVVAQARSAGDTPPRYVAPVWFVDHGGGLTQGVSASGVHVSTPVFALSALETQGQRDLFDYERTFNANVPSVYYEYAVSGVPDGAPVEERWFLNDIRQEAVSSTVAWKRGTYGIVAERLSAPGGSGLPSGTWRLEVWVAGTMQARANLYIGTTPETRGARLDDFGGASAVTADGTGSQGPQASAAALIATFSFKGMAGVQRVQWTVFRNNQRIYQSPQVGWTGGSEGRSWVGYLPGEPITSGRWEFEVRADGQVLATIPVTVP